MEAVIPTRNDYEHLPRILAVLDKIKDISFVHVVDNCSNWWISTLIKSACNNSVKGRYHYSPVQGKGNAIKAIVNHLKEDVLFLDADIENLTASSVRKLLSKLKSADLVKAKITRKNGQSNSAFVSRDLKRLFPKLKVARPTCGIYSIRLSTLKSIDIPNSWSVDLSVLVQTHLQGGKIVEVDLGEIVDKSRDRESLEESKACLKNELEVLKNVANE